MSSILGLTSDPELWQVAAFFVGTMWAIVLGAWALLYARAASGDGR